MIIMTYNIHSGRGIDGRFSLSRIAEVIRESGADIVCLQEVERWMPWGRFTNQPKCLSEILEMDYVFQANIALGPIGFGNVILSRYEIISSASHRLTSIREPRGVLEANIDTPSGNLTVFNTHWGLDRAERERQTEETASFMRAATTPAILCGDLNDPPESSSVKTLIASANLHDLSLECACDSPTFPADNPKYRIDFVLASRSIKAARAFVVDSVASDHRAVAVEVEQ